MSYRELDERRPQHRNARELYGNTKGLVEPGEELILIHLLLMAGVAVFGGALTWASFSVAARPFLLQAGFLVSTPAGPVLTMPWLHGQPVQMTQGHVLTLVAGLVLMFGARSSTLYRRRRHASTLRG